MFDKKIKQTMNRLLKRSLNFLLIDCYISNVVTQIRQYPSHHGKSFIEFNLNNIGFVL